jgi:hypothetical protein
LTRFLSLSRTNRDPGTRRDHPSALYKVGSLAKRLSPSQPLLSIRKLTQRYQSARLSNVPLNCSFRWAGIRVRGQNPQDLRVFVRILQRTGIKQLILSRPRRISFAIALPAGSRLGPRRIRTLLLKES